MITKLLVLAALSTFSAGTIAAIDDASSWVAPLVSTGPLGVVVVWFMVRAEERWKALERALEHTRSSIDRAARAQMLMVLTLKEATSAERAEAQRLINEIDSSHL